MAMDRILRVETRQRTLTTTGPTPAPRKPPQEYSRAQTDLFLCGRKSKKKALQKRKRATKTSLVSPPSSPAQTFNLPGRALAWGADFTIPLYVRIYSGVYTNQLFQTHPQAKPSHVGATSTNPSIQTISPSHTTCIRAPQPSPSCIRLTLLPSSCIRHSSCITQNSSPRLQNSGDTRS